MKVIGKISSAIQWVAERVLVFIAVALVIITFFSVVMRFVFNSPPKWNYELSIVLFSWLTFIGAALAFKRHEHIKLDILENHLKGNARRILEIVLHLVVLLFLAIGLLGGIQVVQMTMAQKYTTIGLPVSIFYFPFSLCMVMSFIFVVEKIMGYAAKTEKA